MLTCIYLESIAELMCDVWTSSFIYIGCIFITWKYRWISDEISFSTSKWIRHNQFWISKADESHLILISNHTSDALIDVDTSIEMWVEATFCFYINNRRHESCHVIITFFRFYSIVDHSHCVVDVEQGTENDEWFDYLMIKCNNIGSFSFCSEYSLMNILKYSQSHHCLLEPFEFSSHCLWRFVLY
jgi:hypothetical protein